MVKKSRGSLSGVAFGNTVRDWEFKYSYGFTTKSSHFSDKKMLKKKKMILYHDVKTLRNWHVQVVLKIQEASFGGSCQNKPSTRFFFFFRIDPEKDIKLSVQSKHLNFFARCIT